MSLCTVMASLTILQVTLKGKWLIKENTKDLMNTYAYMLLKYNYSKSGLMSKNFMMLALSFVYV